MQRKLNLDDIDFDEDLDFVSKPKIFRYDSEQLTKEVSKNDDQQQNPIPSTSGIQHLTSKSQPTSGSSSISATAETAASMSQPSNKKRGVILVNPKQKGNPLLGSIELNAIQFSDIAPDYIMSRTSCALFLSLKYHNVYPNYIYERINCLGKQYQLRVLVVLIDIPNSNQPLKELMQVCLLSDFVLMCSWTFEEAGKIIDTYKVFENRSAESLMDKQMMNKSNEYQSMLDAISSIKSINKTDSISLISTFESLDRLVKATPEQLSVVPGLGPAKAKVLYDFFRRKTKR